MLPRPVRTLKPTSSSSSSLSFLPSLVGGGHCKPDCSVSGFMTVRWLLIHSAKAFFDRSKILEFCCVLFFLCGLRKCSHFLMMIGAKSLLFLGKGPPLFVYLTLSLSLSHCLCRCLCLSDCRSVSLCRCLSLFESVSVSLPHSLFSVSVSLSFCLSVSVSLSLCLCLSVCLTVCLSVSLSPWLPLSDRRSVCLFAFVSVSLPLSLFSVSLSLSVCLSVCISLYPKRSQSILIKCHEL